MKRKFYTVKKTFRIPVGHRLSKHEGLCKNIHGHNFKIEVEVNSFKLNDNDMVIDFSDLKKIVNNALEQFDHATILNNRDHEIIKQFRDNEFKFIMIGGRDPTAEVLSEYFYREIEFKLPKDVIMDSVRVWENEDSVAEFFEIEE
jgi:6-pyruvoyltetrahydropterin/6-carboxytetrahydropterin synthase